MHRMIGIALFVGLLVGVACQAACGSRDGAAAASIESMSSGIGRETCAETVDEDDPNSTPILLCPGVLGYSLVLRHVDSGRWSADVRTPARGDFPLELHVYVTRHMFQLEPQVEWRVSTRRGRSTPIALIIGVQAHENLQEPQEVSRTYLTVAKITAQEICVTNRIVKAAAHEAELRKAADAASGERCLEPLPYLGAD